MRMQEHMPFRELPERGTQGRDDERGQRQDRCADSPTDTTDRSPVCSHERERVEKSSGRLAHARSYRDGIFHPCLRGNIPHWLRLSLSVLFLATLFAGCAATPESQFYVLQPREWSAPVPKAAAEPIAIALHPVTLPGYLDRPHIVTGKGSVGIDVAEFHRWGEPLDCGVDRVLCASLKKSLPSHSVTAFPWGAIRPELQVKVTVNAFIATPGAKARLAADCRLFGRDGNGITHTASHERPVGADYTNIVQTMSALVDDLGRGLAEKIAGSRNGE
jgi:uncharacterized protein